MDTTARTIIDTPGDKTLDIEIVVPVADMTNPSVGSSEVEQSRKRSIWPAMYPRLLDLVNGHRSTLFFVNSRGFAERLAAELNGLAGEEVVQAHHGSVSREKRIDIEARLEQGELKGVVATGTLELGIDMAAIDLVVLVESPSSVARGLQRVGRAGHQVGAPSVAKIFPKHRGAQFGLPSAIDRLRISGRDELVILAAADPANPFGSILLWPLTEGWPTRTAGARVASSGGSLLAWMDRAGKRICCFSSESDRVASAVEMLARAHGRASIEQVDGTPIHDHELAPALLEQGFVSGYKGFTLPTNGPLSRR